MNPIEKTISRDPKNRRASLIYHHSVFISLSIVSFIVIFGIETYYRNVTGEEGTIYVAGFFTWVIGAMLLPAILRRRKSSGGFQAWAAANGGAVNERIRIDQSGLCHEIEGYCTSELNWSSFVFFKEKKKSFEIVMGGGTFIIPKKFLDPEELLSVRSLLTRKTEAKHPDSRFASPR